MEAIKCSYPNQFTQPSKLNNMKKIDKIKLEIIAIKLWFQAFSDTNLCDDIQRNYMSKKLRKLYDEEYIILAKSSNIKLIN
jgi:hypothetical protein